MKRAVGMFGVILVACSSGATDTPLPAPDAAAVGMPDAAPSGPDGASPQGLDRFYDDAARAICGALYRCCDGADVETYFAAHRNSDLLADFHHRLPPNASMDEAGCRSVVGEMLAVTPFGDWVAEARRGRVVFDPGALNRCIQSLDNAACGDESRAALFDGSCLGFSPPAGGGRQRDIFRRTARPGAACGPIRDGVGAAFYGTCDPTAGYCCYTDPANPELGCTYPFEGDGTPRQGTCTATVSAGGSCSAVPPLQLCQTGVNCDSNTDTCVPESTSTLSVGDTCADEGFNLLGVCQNSFCDLLGTNQCEPLRDDGASCTGAYECQSGGCNGGVCGPNELCNGTGGSGPDAGAGDPDAGAPMADAGVADAEPSQADASVGAGETCADAGDLAVSSSASTTPGFDYRIAASFGGSNDYNPYQGASPQLPPACSLVYDAAGNEVVYALTLDPGDRLELRLSVAPSSVAPAVYLLDSCGASPTWPDYDESGMCGSNEYKSAGFCGVLGCDPMDWAFTYPTEVAGTPTATRRFYLVVDTIGTAVPTGFELDWRVVSL